MKDLLLNLIGATETKIFMLDVFIKLAKKNNGFVTLEMLEEIRDNVVKEAGRREIGDALDKLKEDQLESSANLGSGE